VASLFSDIKIAEGESPRPTDRCFYKFNYYDDLNRTRWADPGAPLQHVDLYRNVFGFEKTLCDGAFSFGLRVPFNTLDAEGRPGGDPGFDSTQFGNITAVFKAVLWEARSTGDLISGGATATFPTASSTRIDPGPSAQTYAQPFVGCISVEHDLFVQGFGSILFPLGGREAIVLFLDVGAGYYVYHGPAGSPLTAVAPTLELHLASPLRQGEPTVNVFGLVDDGKFHNVIDVTLGTTFEFANHATLGVGVAVPLTGPKPFSVEALVQLNYRF
jgi:hypothetical protein